MEYKREPTSAAERDWSRVDEWFGVNLRAEREKAGESQASLAKKMEGKGFKPFHAMTISRIEAGERPVRLGEAHALAEIVGSSAYWMTRPPDEQRAIARLSRALDAVRDPLLDIAHRTYFALTNKPQLESEINKVFGMVHDHPLLAEAAEWLNREPEEFVKRGRDDADLTERQEQARDAAFDEHHEAIVARDFAAAGYPIKTGSRVEHNGRAGVAAHLSAKRGHKDFAVYVEFDDGTHGWAHPEDLQSAGESSKEAGGSGDRIEEGSDVLVESRGSGVTLAVNGTGADTTYTVQLYEGGQPIEVPHNEVTRTVDSRRAAEEVRDGVDQASP